jgi:hypothetical protein
MSSGVYGTIITAFYDLAETVTYFDQAPAAGSSWGARTDVQTIQVVIQCKDGRRAKNSNGNLVTTRGIQIWYEGELTMGRFIDDGKLIYRIAKDDAWTNEAGFTIYGVDKIVGADGTEVTEPAFNNGTQGAGSYS